MTAPALTPLPCGGCGNDDPTNRCMGCLHDFGTPDSAWVQANAARFYTETATQAALLAERDTALECVAIEATARGIAETRVAELEGLAGAMFAAQDAYLILPNDRGGATGPKSTASFKFMQAMAELRAALTKEPTP